MTSAGQAAASEVHAGLGVVGEEVLKKEDDTVNLFAGSFEVVALHFEVAHEAVLLFLVLGVHCVNVGTHNIDLEGQRMQELRRWHRHGLSRTRCYSMVSVGRGGEPRGG